MVGNVHVALLVREVNRERLIFKEMGSFGRTPSFVVSLEPTTLVVYVYSHNCGDIHRYMPKIPAMCGRNFLKNRLSLDGGSHC